MDTHHCYSSAWTLRRVITSEKFTKASMEHMKRVSPMPKRLYNKGAIGQP